MVKPEALDIDTQIVVLDKYTRFIESCVTAARVVRRHGADPKQIYLFVLYSAYSTLHTKPEKGIPPDCMTTVDIDVIQSIHNVHEFGRLLRSSVIESKNNGAIVSFGVFLDNVTFIDRDWIEAFGVEVFCKAAVRMLVRASTGSPKVFFDDIEIDELAFYVQNEQLEVVCVAVHKCILYAESAAGVNIQMTRYAAPKESENLYARQFTKLFFALQRAGIKIAHDTLSRWYSDELRAAGMFEDRQKLHVVYPGQIKIKKEESYLFPQRDAQLGFRARAHVDLRAHAAIRRLGDAHVPLARRERPEERAVLVHVCRLSVGGV